VFPFSASFNPVLNSLQVRRGHPLKPLAFQDASESGVRPGGTDGTDGTIAQHNLWGGGCPVPRAPFLQPSSSPADWEPFQPGTLPAWDRSSLGPWSAPAATRIPHGQTPVKGPSLLALLINIDKGLVRFSRIEPHSGGPHLPQRVIAAGPFLQPSSSPADWEPSQPAP
jgi:hypothetical protein